MHQIEVSNIKIDVIRKDIKNMHLAVYPPTGRIRIAAPLRINDEAIRLFAISKIAWIKRQQRKFQEQDRETNREYSTRESHYFLGKRYLLNVIEQNATPKVILRNKTYIDLFLRPAASIHKREEVMIEWYRSELKKLIPPIIKKYEKKLGLQCIDWGVKPRCPITGIPAERIRFTDSITSSPPSSFTESAAVSFIIRIEELSASIELPW